MNYTMSTGEWMATQGFTEGEGSLLLIAMSEDIEAGDVLMGHEVVEVTDMGSFGMMEIVLERTDIEAQGPNDSGLLISLTVPKGTMLAIMKK